MASEAIDIEKIYKTYEPKVRAYITGRVSTQEDINDLCSEVFLRVMQKKTDFSGEPKAVSSWIYMITKNCVIDHYKTRHLSCEIPDDITDETDIEMQTINTEQLRLLADSLKKLDDRLRTITVRHYYSGVSLKDIADELDISYSYVKLLHKKALESLKQMMQA